LRELLRASGQLGAGEKQSNGEQAADSGKRYAAASGASIAIHHDGSLRTGEGAAPSRRWRPYLERATELAAGASIDMSQDMPPLYIPEMVQGCTRATLRSVARIC